MKEKLQLMETVVYKNNDRRERYNYEYSSLKDTVDLMLYLESVYGTIDDVFVYSTGKYTNHYYGEYDSIEEFANVAMKEKEDNFGIILLECKDRWICFRLKYDTNSVWVDNDEPSMGELRHDPDNIEYYRDLSDGTIIKYDKNDQSLYSFNKKENRWNHNRFLRYSFFSHDDYNYELVEKYKDPADNT